MTISTEHLERDEAFAAEVVRLRRAVRELTGQLDRVEADVRRVIDDLLRQRLEAYR